MMTEPAPLNNRRFRFRKGWCQIWHKGFLARQAVRHLSTTGDSGELARSAKFCGTVFLARHTRR